MSQAFDEKRFEILAMPEDLILDIACGVLRLSPELPGDLEIVSVHANYAERCVDLVVASMSYRPLPPGAAIRRRFYLNDDDRSWDEPEKPIWVEVTK